MLKKEICKHCLHEYYRNIKKNEWSDYREILWEEEGSILCPIHLRRRQPVANAPTDIRKIPSYCPFHLEHRLADEERVQTLS